MVGAAELSVVIAGALATFFSPCAYALLPGYVGYTMNRSEQPGIGLSLVRGAAAGMGVLLALGAVTGLFVTVGARFVARVWYFELLVGLGVAAFGLMLLLDRAPSLRVALPARRTGTLGFGIFGAGYAVASVGCVLPVFVAVVGTASTLPLMEGLLLVGVYVGIVVVLMIATTVAAGVGTAGVLTRLSPHTGTIRRVAGLILLLAGIGQLWIATVVSPTIT